jgi:hypothetical protein
MKRTPLTGATATLAALTVSLPLLAAEALPWPWKDKTPPDPALTTLYQIDGVTASVEGEILSISVEATAATPGFTELQLVPRMGDPSDLIFAFDAKGRPPQDMTIQVLKPVSFSAKYEGAPLDKVGVVEVYGQSNCKAFSLKEGKAVDCTAGSMPQ